MKHFWHSALCLVASGLFAHAADPVLIPAQTLHQPRPTPDRVILTWSGDPATTQAVTWRTDTTVLSGKAQLAVSQDGPNFDPISKDKGKPTYVTLEGTSQLLKTQLNEAHYHTVEFTGLTPETKYVYRVGDGVNWTEWYQFETASQEAKAFSFIYVGDAQNEIKRHWSRVIRGAYSEMPKAKFILHAGDLINSGPRDDEWGEWHNAAGWINAMIPAVPTPGNHEYGGNVKPTKEVPKPKARLTSHWRPQFALPTHGPAGLEETVYYFDYQGVRFVSLNSNENPQDQVPWLENVLSSNPHRWSILTFHHPIYSPAKNRDNKALRELWRPIIDKYKVDLVLTGHDHTYGRSSLMREDNTLSGERLRSENGTVYVVSVSGPKMYPLSDSAEWVKVKAQDTQLYQIITVDGNRLHFIARTPRGEIRDEFELRKASSGINNLIERESLELERGRENSPSRTQLLYATGALILLPLLYVGFRFVRRMSAR
jgi:3',5'-cyclic AMP phosphodiesterase CpdA